MSIIRQQFVTGECTVSPNFRDVDLEWERWRANEQAAAGHTEGNLQKLSSLLFTTLISIVALAQEGMAQTSAVASAARVVSTNDNTRSVGRIEGDVLNLELYAAVGTWRPQGPQGAPIEIAAFGVEGAELSIPGPLIRVREGTTVVLTLRNGLESALSVNGLCTRPSTCDLVSVAPGASQEIRFSLNAPGTYFYWAATRTGPMNVRRRGDSQLGGAIVVDPREGSPADRVFVISTFGEPPAPDSPGESLTSSPSTARRGRTLRSFTTKLAIGCAGASSTCHPARTPCTCTASIS